MRLIDADAFLEQQLRIARLNETDWQDGYWAGVDDTLGDIADAPTIKTEPKRGRWIFIDDLVAPDLECSLCHELAGMDIDAEHTVRSNFCPNCGADMRERKGDDG